MGLFKKVFRPVRKIAKKIIPKEIRPFLPYVAAMIPGAQGLASLNKFMTPVFQKALLAGATSAATDEQGNPLRAAALAAAPDVLSKGLGAVGTKLGVPGGVDVEKTMTFAERIGEGARTAQGAIGRTNPLKIAGAQTAIDQSAKFAEIRQDEIDEYNRSLQEQGVLDKTKRRTAIFNIYKNAGYEDDYVNSMLDRYGYAIGGRIGFANGGYRGKAEAAMGLTTMKDLLKGKTKAPIIEIEEDEEVVLPKSKSKNDDDDDDRPIIRKEPKYAQAMKDAMAGVEAAFGIPFAGVAPAEFKRFARGGEVEEGIMSKIIDSMGDDYDYFTRIKMRENLKQGETVEDAADLAEQEAMERVKEKYGFARGGEVEIEEQVDDLGTMDLMKDQGIPYGEQVSAPNNFAELNMLAIDLFGRPYDQLSDGEQETLMDFIGSKSQAGGKGIMQMASGYKSDIEEMYEQYVFEMEEQGLEPMDFASFLRQARSGMANGGKVKRRKKGEPADEVIETEEEIFLDKMPRPKRKGIMEVASGGIMNKNLLNTGMDKDMRGGGFIPEGTKEKADDVPARLSKNEFVMTADAVRAAGGGSVNKGAKRMYDLMYTLEAKV